MKWRVGRAKEGVVLQDGERELFVTLSQLKLSLVYLTVTLSFPVYCEERHQERYIYDIDE